MQLVLDTSGIKLGKKAGVFHIVLEEKEKAISPAKLTSIAITANVELSTEAVLLAVKNQLPILFFNRIGKPQARIWSPYFSSIATLRRHQVSFTERVEATDWIVNLFELKTAGQLANLKFLREKTSKFSVALNTAIGTIRRNGHNFDAFRPIIIDKARNQIMGVEGSIARVYWQSVGASIPRAFRFNKRSRKPAEDNFNAALNYLYGMLYSVVEGGILDAGLDPHLGMLHTDEYAKPTLSFDLIEPFRPWIDHLLIKACIEKKVQTEFFSKNQYGIFLNKNGKAFFIPAFNDLMRNKKEFLGVESTIKNHIHFLAAKLAQRIRSTIE